MSLPETTGFLQVVTSFGLISDLFRACWWPPFRGTTGRYEEAGRWLLLKIVFLIFTSKFGGNSIQFDEYIFQMGGKKTPTREFCWCFGKVSELLQMELTQKNSNAWKHFWVWTKGRKNKWKEEIWPTEIPKINATNRHTSSIWPDTAILKYQQQIL